MTQGTTVPSAVRGSPRDTEAVLAIRWVAPEEDGRLTAIGPGATLLGRDPDCAGALPSTEISRKHAEIRWIGAIPMLRDLDSTNGVFLNGQRLSTQAPLRARDVVRLGDWVGVVTSVRRDAPGAWVFEEIIPGYWGGAVLLEAFAAARKLAASDLPIVIQGETGAGKEGAARAIHDWSGRRGRFVGLNCAALPETLAEGELFGYRKGAFTGADRANTGHLRAAEGGTLFLDEIADLPLPVQAKLLRAIEEREVVPLGETTPVRIDVRLLAASQGPLLKAVDEKRFRGDLYARLQGFALAIPPLRDRIEEVPFLFRKLLARAAGGGGAPRLDPLLVEKLCAHGWPFNVRELALLARRLAVLHPGVATLDAAMWTEPPAAAAPSRPAEEPARGTGADVDADAFLLALRANQGNVKSTAAALGISRGRAYRLMEQLDALDLDEIRKPAPGPSNRPGPTTSED